jgi:hypothetical protein
MRGLLPSSARVPTAAAVTTTAATTTRTRPPNHHAARTIAHVLEVAVGNAAVVEVGNGRQHLRHQPGSVPLAVGMPLSRVQAVKKLSTTAVLLCMPGCGCEQNGEYPALDQLER